MKTLHPTPGRAFITPENRIIDSGLIKVPERFGRKKKAVARVSLWKAGYRRRCSDCGHIQHTKGDCRGCQSRRLEMISEAPTAPFAVDISGMRVMYAETSVLMITDDIWVLPIDDIIAIIPDGFELEGAKDDNGIRRCVLCGPCQEGSTQGMVMTIRKGRHVCPRCHKDESGTVVPV